MDLNMKLKQVHTYSEQLGIGIDEYIIVTASPECPAKPNISTTHLVRRYRFTLKFESQGSP